MKNTLINNKLLIIIILLGLISFSVKSQSFSSFEIENLSNLMTKDYSRPQINIYANSFKSNPKVGFYYFALINQYWAQAYGGVIIKPYNWMSVSIGAGLEVDENPYRLNVSLIIEKTRFNFIQIYEYGGSGFWYNVQANYKINQQNYLGVVGKRYYGVGINYEHNLKQFPLTFTVSPLYDFEDETYKLMIAVKYYL